MYKTCPFCHQQVPVLQYAAHEAAHTQLRPDGQMRDHVTVPPQQRYAGNINQVPRWYVHSRCGAVTGMPDEVIRSYLADPFLYNNTSFCTGCGTYVPESELYWQGTNQSLADYSRQLRIDHIQRNGLNPSDFDWGPNGPTRRSTMGSLSRGLLTCIVGAVGLVLFIGCCGTLFLFAAQIQAEAEVKPPAAEQVRTLRVPPPPPPVVAHEPPKFNFEPPTVPPAPDFDNDFVKRQQQRRTEMQARVEETHKRMREHHEEAMERMRRQREEMNEQMRGFNRPAMPRLP